MSAFFRSEEMSKCRIYAQCETAFEIVANLGRVGIASFIDMNSEKGSLARPFMVELARCDTINTHLAFLSNQLELEQIQPNTVNLDHGEIPKYADFHRFESLVASYYNGFDTLNQNYNLIVPQYSQALDELWLIKILGSIVESTGLGSLADRDFTFGEQNLISISGFIDSGRLLSFERVLWRLFGSNILVKIVHLDQQPLVPHSITQNRKLFLIYFKGENVHRKLIKICNCFGASLYELPKEKQEREWRIEAVKKKCDDHEVVLRKSKDYVHNLLRKVAEEIESWNTLLAQYRAIFYNLNKFDFDSFYKCLLVELWCISKDRSNLAAMITDISSRFTSPVVFEPCVVVDGKPKPTHFRLNQFTAPFQSLVESYGIASYQEINPAPFTIVTFPFLFAIMFGDVGHGLILAVFALWMVASEASLQSANEIFQLLFTGRYIILLMGLFAIYTGFIYNEFFAKSLNLFGSGFTVAHWANDTRKVIQLDPEKYLQATYPFGMDPIWNVAKNRILFLNSYKMKLSVLVGVSQMTFGLFLSLANQRFFGRIENILFEFFPQLIFLLTIFGYMNILILIKWFVFTSADSSLAPSILINLINMFLVKYPEDGPEYLQPWYTNQRTVQLCLLATALICVPWILFPKVFYLRSQKDLGPEFQDTLIQQTIHTIEYCLGSISHTASYLRLWALSLAHSQLSDVLWAMVMRPALQASLGNPALNALFTVGLFSLWAILTIAILVTMEGLSAFLHSLRLHWVEFQSKFYTGNGIKFEPFQFKHL